MIKNITIKKFPFLKILKTDEYINLHTFHSLISVNRLASMHPAVPPPTIIKSYSTGFGIGFDGLTIFVLDVNILYTSWRKSNVFGWQIEAVLPFVHNCVKFWGTQDIVSSVKQYLKIKFF